VLNENDSEAINAATLNGVAMGLENASEYSLVFYEYYYDAPWKVTTKLHLLVVT
jgi:hypothetical protein